SEPRTPASPRRSVPEAVARSQREAEPSKVHAGRADTIALVDRVGQPREVSNVVAIGVIVALSALAGIGAYVLRSASDAPPAGPTASAPRLAPSAPSFRQDRR